MLIACDLDRTLLPNGDEPDDGMLPVFFSAMSKAKHTLVYVTGRNLALVEEAKNEFELETPDYLLGEVGTVLYHKSDAGELEIDSSWQEYLQNETTPWDWNTICSNIRENDSLYLQEDWRQNPFKISYYKTITHKKETIETLSQLRTTLEQLNIDAQVIYSEDPVEQIGLIDILPTKATKETALRYLAQQLSFGDNEIIYCGDSGNDILPLTCGFKSVLVKNASKDVIQEVFSEAKRKGTSNSVYIAKGCNTLNGNYASGVIEGLIHHGALQNTDI
jgi:sucrose-6F-phosphate phosphohydrolase